MAEDKDKTPKSDINFEFGQGVTGLNMDNIPSQIGKGSLSYALNAALENFDSNSVTYQNEPGNEFCLDFPKNYVVIGRYNITEQSKQIYFLSNPNSGDSEIGYVINNDCVYHTIVNAKCLNFDINYPIHKVVHKTSNCGTEIYWAQPNDDRKYLNLENPIPKIPFPGSTPCDESLTELTDCNQFRVQPNYSVPKLYVKDVIIGGNLTAGTYQFAFQYSDALGNPLSSYYSVTNPTPIADIQVTTVNFNYPVGKAIVLSINDVELGGQFDFFNIAVIKTINGITSVELVGTYGIEGADREITYTGQNVTQARLTVNDIFEKFPFYGPADDVTTSQDVLIWKGLSSPQRVNYQKIANKIILLWETWRIPPDQNYANELNATNLRGYLRDEVYPFEIVFILRSGQQTDGFHIPGRRKTLSEESLGLIDPSNNDFIEDPDEGPVEYWKIYNTARVIDFSDDYNKDDINYRGPYQYGAFSYWESEDTYPCEENIWGELASQPIRHHKFPDVEVSPIIESKVFGGAANMEMGNVAIFPIGVKVNIEDIKRLIIFSDLTPAQKADIVAFKIVRGDRTDNKSIVAKGILRNVNKYTRDEQEVYYANYPYNDLNADPFLNEKNNAYTIQCMGYDINIYKFNVTPAVGAPYTEIQYTDCNTNKTITQQYTELGYYSICSLTIPILLGEGKINTFFSDVTSEGPNPINSSNVNPNTATITEQYYQRWQITIAPATIISTPDTDDVEVFCQGSQFLYKNVLGKDFTLNIYPGETTVLHVYPGPNSMPVCRFCSGCTVACTGNACQFTRTYLETVNTACTIQVPQPPVDPALSHRQIFNSPETSFGQPFLGDILKLESVIYGTGQAHFVEVKDNAKYRLLTKEAQEDALTASGKVGDGNAAAVFTAYQAYLEIYINGITRKNYAYSFNSIADYNYSVAVPDDQGVKQRRLDFSKYLIPAVQSIGEGVIDINNYQRETSVYLKTDDAKDPFLFPHLSPNMIPIGVTDVSRFIIGCKGAPPCEEAVPEPTTTSTTTNPLATTTSTTTVFTVPTTTTTTMVPGYCPGSCSAPAEKHPISVVSYYASLKNTFRNQWGQIYSYQTIDTGYLADLLTDEEQLSTVFGGDTFICRFAFKTKVPFFIDNRVGAPDDSEIFYDELGNIAYPKFWHSARSILADFVVPDLNDNKPMVGIISYKAHNFDCPNCQEPAPYSTDPPLVNPQRTFYDGYFYLFAYGIPNFYVETSYNIDLRQAFNNKEGDFWPHVTSGIPDDWVQESWVTIAQDNTYYYNTTFSKQNKETFFSHIPANFEFKNCEFIYPFRAIFSDPQVSTVNTTVNNWLTYRASSFFDFPQNHGNLVSLDGIENRVVLARFENKSLLYNALYTTQTNTGGQIYLGQPLFSPQSPPLDFAQTDLGYVGCQHKFILNIPQGHITVDAKRGQIFLLGSKGDLKDLTEPGTGMNRFFTDHLAFEILRYFPAVNIDNHFTSVGLHGVYDSKFDRIIITKLDYVPLDSRIKYDDVLKEFYIEEVFPSIPVSTSSSETIIRTKVLLSDTNYFCNKSWTISYSFITNSWISFHSYIPNWYMGENNFFYSGKKSCCSDFDFVFLAGELIPDPPTTTTTSSSTTSTSSTTTTTTTKSCNLVGGTAVVLECNLGGTCIILVPTPPIPCTRPDDVDSIFLSSGYNIITPASTVISTGSFAEACTAKGIVVTAVSNITPVNVRFFVVGGTSPEEGAILYADNGTNDCTRATEGFYYTQATNDVIYQINSSGVLVDKLPCVQPSTTSTTTTCPMYLYAVEFYTCATCTFIETGTIGNSALLPTEMFFADPISGYKMKIKTYLGCGTGTNRNILASSAIDNCPGVTCSSTDSYYRYTTGAIANCVTCATIFIVGDIINAQPLVEGKWYYNSANNFRYSTLAFVGMDPGPATHDIDPATEQDSCAEVICPTTTTTTTITV